MKDGWDDEDDESTVPRKSPNQISGLAPRYGGVPVELSLLLAQAKENDDTEVEGNVHKLRKMYFRNRRTPEEKERAEAVARKNFTDKYGVKGQIAIKVTQQALKYEAIAAEEAKKEAAMAEAGLEEEITIVNKPKKRSTKGGK